MAKKKYIAIFNYSFFLVATEGRYARDEKVTIKADNLEEAREIALKYAKANSDPMENKYYELRSLEEVPPKIKPIKQG